MQGQPTGLAPLEQVGVKYLEAPLAHKGWNLRPPSLRMSHEPAWSCKSQNSLLMYDRDGPKCGAFVAWWGGGHDTIQPWSISRLMARRAKLKTCRAFPWRQRWCHAPYCWRSLCSLRCNHMPWQHFVVKDSQRANCTVPTPPAVFHIVSSLLLPFNSLHLFFACSYCHSVSVIDVYTISWALLQRGHAL